MANVIIPLKVRISAVIILVVLLPTVLTAIAFSVYRHNEIREFEETFLADTVKDIKTLAYVVTPHLIENDYVFMNNLVSHEKKQSNRVYVLIEDNNKIVVHSDRADIGSVFKIPLVRKTEKIDEGVIRRYYKAGREIIDISYPIKAGDLALGTVRIGLDTDWLREEIRRTKQIMFTFSLVVAEIGRAHV